jgi:glutathione S-transferase
MIRLHHSHQTRSMRSLWLLHELGVAFEVAVRPFDKSLRSEAYLKINPTGRVPALEHEDDVICESGAIAAFLCATYPGAGLGRVQGDAEWAAWLDWVHYAETISQHTAALTQQHVALYDDSMRSPIVMQLEAKRLAKCLAVVDAALVKNTYLLTSGFSAADIGVGQAVYMAQHFVRLDGFSHLQRWFALISDRPAFQASLPPEGEGLYGQEFYTAWD